MKKISFILFALTAILFYSCDDAEPLDPVLATQSTNSGGSTQNYYFKVDFDGQTWEATSNMMQAIEESGNIGSFSGLNSNGSSVSLIIPSFSEGTYNWSNSSNTPNFLLTYLTNLNGDGYISFSNSMASGINGYTDTAEVIITEINTTNQTVKGTFEFTGIKFDSTLPPETKVFTNGSFYMPYTTISDNNSFFCKINGTDYITTSITGAMGTSGTNNTIGIIGRRNSNESITINLDENISVGTHNIEALSSNAINTAMYLNPNADNFYSDSGTVTITTHDTSNKHLVGTFEFTGTGLSNGVTYNVTNGSFDIYYQ